MKIYIEYEVTTAAGHKAKKCAYAYTLKKASELCESIEKIGYKLTMVNREE